MRWTYWKLMTASRLTEKRDAVIKLLTQKGDTELSRLLSERTVADKTGVEIKTDFWKSGTVIPAGDTVYLRPVESNDP